MRTRNLTKDLRGYVLSPFGSFGSFNFGEFQVVGPGTLAFQNSWTNDDWKSANHKWKDHIAYWFHLSYEPLDPDVVTRAIQKLDLLNVNFKAGDVTAGALRNSLLTPIASLIKQGDANTSQFDNLGNASDATHQARFQIFNSLNDAITKLANVKIPAFTPAVDDSGVIPGVTAAGGTPNAFVAQAQAQAAAARAAAAKAEADAAAAARAAAAKAEADAAAAANAEKLKKSSSLLDTSSDSKLPLILGVGAGVIGLAVVGVMLTKKKKVA